MLKLTGSPKPKASRQTAPMEADFATSTKLTHSRAFALSPERTTCRASQTSPEFAVAGPVMLMIRDGQHQPRGPAKAEQNGDFGRCCSREPCFTTRFTVIIREPHLQRAVTMSAPARRKARWVNSEVGHPQPVCRPGPCGQDLTRITAAVANGAELRAMMFGVEKFCCCAIYRLHLLAWCWMVA